MVRLVPNTYCIILIAAVIIAASTQRLPVRTMKLTETVSWMETLAAWRHRCSILMTISTDSWKAQIR